MTLRFKTSALLALVVTVSLALSGLVYLHYQERALKESIFQGAEGMAATTAHAITSFLNDALLDAQTVATTLPLETFENDDVSGMERHLEQMLQLHPKFENGMFILDKNGKFVADFPSHRELRGKSFAHRDYYQRTIDRQRGAVGTPYRSARTGKPVLTFTATIRNRANQIIGLIGCSADLLSPSALGNLRNQHLGKTGYIYLIDGSRLMIMHPDDERILVRDVPPGANRLLDAALNGFDGVGEAIDSSMGSSGLDPSFQGSGNTVNSRGVPMLLALKHIPNTNWILGVQQPQEEAYRSIAAAKWRIVLITLISMMAAALLGTILVARITTPLTRLRLATVNIGNDLASSGDIHHESASARAGLRQIRGDDEIGDLARSFEALIGQLDVAITASQSAARDWAQTFDSVHDAVFIVDPECRVVRINRIAAEWFRIPPDAAREFNCQNLIFGDAPPPPEWSAIQTMSDGQQVRMAIELTKLQGIFDLVATPIMGPSGAGGAVLILRNITEAKRAEDRIHEMAFYDALTGLPNRPLLMERMRMALANASRNNLRFGVLFLDLDRFKHINDTLGHEGGDDLLSQVAKRLTTCLRQNDTAARLGGDEFVVILEEIGHADDAATVAHKITRTILAPYRIAGQEIHITTSIGIALYPNDGNDNPTLLKHADRAMYLAKERGRNGYQFFSTDPDASAPES